MYRINKTKQKLLEKRFAFGVAVGEMRQITLPTIFANLGFDFLFIDMEHSASSFESIADLAFVARNAGITPIARVYDPVRFCISRILDCGAQGVIVPRIETIEQVDAVVSFSRYPPVGTRSAALGGRHLDFKGPKDQRGAMDEANRQVLVGIQIETKLGLDRVEELISRPGVDLVFIGPSDLSVALNVPGDYHSPKMTQAVATIIAAANKYNLPVGVQGRNLELAAVYMKQGIHLIVYGNDTMLLSNGAMQGIKGLRDLETDHGRK